jgi:hypothetical protein
MGFLNKLFGGSGPTEEELSQAPLDEEVEQRMEQLEEQNEELRQELRSKEQDESARTGRLEERLQEERQEKKKMQNQLQSQGEQLQEMQQKQSGATTSTPPPDDSVIEGLPVISADGNKNFGKFKKWISQGNKVGIAASHPRRDKKIEKVGWADSIRELVFDANNLKDKEMIIVKLDAKGDHVDYVNMHQHKEVLQKKERLEDQKQRLSMENDELIKQVRKLERLNQKLIIISTMDRMDSKEPDGTKDLALRKMSTERKMDKGQIESLAEQNKHKRNRTDQLISQYENNVDERMERMTMDDAERSIQDVGDMMSNLGGELGEVLSQLDPETREDVMRAIGGGDGGQVAITED